MKLLAQGRAADVYEYGEGLVLRRYRTPHYSLYEAAVMQHVREHGYPAPEVVVASGPDIVMERLEGPTMLTDMSKRPWRLRAHARTLASLMKRLHDLPAPDWLWPKLAGGDRLVHLDLHPDNVMLTSRGPIVIDWSNAGRGDSDAEVADVWLVMANAEIPVGGVRGSLMRAFRGLFVRSFVGHFDDASVRRQLRTALGHRLRDRNMREAERERMAKFVERYAL